MHKSFLVIIGTLVLFSGTLNAQKTEVTDSLKALLTAAEASEQFDIYLKLAENTQVNSPDTGAIYLKKAKDLAELNNQTNRSFRYYSALSRNKLYLHEYDSLLFYAEKALDLEDVSSPEGMLHLHSTVGTSHYYTSEYEKAINAHLTALRIADENKITDQYPNIYNNMSVVYLGMQDWLKSEEYLLKAIDLAEKDDNTYEASRGASNLAIVYAMQEKFDLAEEMFKKDIELQQRLGNLMAVSKGHNNLGVLYEYKDDLRASLENYETALEIAQKINDKASVALGYQNVASAQRKLGMYKEALKNYQIGLPLNRSQGNRNILRDGLLGISELYETLGNMGKALEYHQQYHLLNDSLISEEHLSAVSELEIKYETEKKEKDILALSEKSLKSEAAILEQNTWIRRLSIGLIGTILLFLAAFIIFRQRSRNQKQRELITAIADTQIAERKRISRDLHDSVGGSLALAKNKLQALFEKQDSKSRELEDSLNTLSKTADQVRQISHNLMPGELVKFGLVSAIQTTLDHLQDTELRAQLYSHDMDKRIDPTKEIHLFRILQEIIQNVLKHSKASQLNVYLNKHKKYLNLMVEDNGIGMPERTVSNFGMGLNNVRSRVALLEGTLNIDSVKNQGTTMNMQIPM
ncbi:MAG: tetratricopeptide repeat protein [Flavobacteriaceae bacterium]